MKIIDKKGRLFGIINIIDLMIIFLIGIAALYGVNRLKPITPILVDENVGQNVDVALRVFVNEVRRESVNVLVKDLDVFESAPNNYLGKIVDVKVRPAKRLVTTQEGTVVSAEVPERYDIELIIHASARVQSSGLVAAKKDLKVGVPLQLETKLSRFGGVIFEIKELENN